MTSGARPRTLWFVAPALLFIAGVVLLAMGIIRVTGSHALTLHPLIDGASVQSSSDGFGVYATPVPRDYPTCQAFDSDARADARAVNLPRSTGQNELTLNGVSYREVAISPPSLPAGSYNVACAGGDYVRLATGVRGFESLAAGIVLIVIGALLCFVALILAVVLLVVRLVSGRRPSRPPGPPGYEPPSWGRPAFGPPGWQPPPGSGGWNGPPSSPGY